MIDDRICFILSHFKGQEFLFPRSIMTFKTNGQVFVENKEQIDEYFTDANFMDCRINGYPKHDPSGRNHLYPSFIFIDLDLSLCSTCKYPIRKLDYILNQTLKRIKEEIGGHPSVLWTGGGYHIYQPIKVVTMQQEKIPLEFFKDFEEFTPNVRVDLTTKFIRFASKYLTNGKGDPKHNPSIHSCLTRIPDSINSKYNEKVKIIQEWDSIEANANLIVPSFLDNLINTNQEYGGSIKKEFSTRYPKCITTITWIEKLLQTPIKDHRYFCLWHILIPYLVNIKKLPRNEVIFIIVEWLDKCNKTNKIRWKYPQRINEQLRYDKGFPPISLENLKKENFALYKLLDD